jgi:hypothetical protein
MLPLLESSKQTLTTHKTSKKKLVFIDENHASKLELFLPCQYHAVVRKPIPA